ncbi:MAG: hypothetical protein ACE5LU_05095 [Anaerolineae bacterium]
MKMRGFIVMSLVLVVLLAAGVSLISASPLAQEQPEGFAVISAPGNQVHPQLAYNPNAQQHMVVWSDEQDIFAQRLSRQGQANPPIIPISTARGRQDWPAVAFDPAQDRYLVIWDDDRNAAFTGHDLWGRFFDPNGAPMGAEFIVITAPGNQRQPRLVFNSTQQSYLLVWRDSRNAAATGLDIWGQLLFNSGLRRGGSFSISTAPADQSDPAVAFNPSSNDYVVYWSDNRDPESKNLYGQRLAPGPGAANKRGREIDRLVDNDSNQFAPSLSFDEGQNEYLVVWCDDRGGPETFLDLMIRRLGGNGFPSAETDSFVSTTGDQASSGLAYDSDARVNLAVWGDNRNLFTGGWDIFGEFWPASP